MRADAGLRDERSVRNSLAVLIGDDLDHDLGSGAEDRAGREGRRAHQLLSLGHTLSANRKPPLKWAASYVWLGRKHCEVWWFVETFRYRGTDNP